MHLIKLAAPRLDGDNQWKDIDFTPAGIAARQLAGYDAAKRAIAARPWKLPTDPTKGLTVFAPDAAPAAEKTT